MEPIDAFSLLGCIHYVLSIRTLAVDRFFCIFFFFIVGWIEIKYTMQFQFSKAKDLSNLENIPNTDDDDDEVRISSLRPEGNENTKHYQQLGDV